MSDERGAESFILKNITPGIKIIDETIIYPDGSHKWSLRSYDKSGEGTDLSYSGSNKEGSAFTVLPDRLPEMATDLSPVLQALQAIKNLKNKN